MASLGSSPYMEHLEQLVPSLVGKKTPRLLDIRGAKLLFEGMDVMENNIVVIHTMETDMVKLVVEIECFGMSFDEFDKATGSSNGL
ncbi:hypothetical protein Tco_1459599 [Tanacetum coccineum]